MKTRTPYGWSVGVVTSLGLAIYIVSCTDQLPPGPMAAKSVREGASSASGPVTAAPGSGAVGPRVTPAELRARNPYSWVGDVHNQVLTDLIRTLASGEKVDPCLFAEDWFRKPVNIAALERKVGPRLGSLRTPAARSRRGCRDAGILRGGTGLFQQVSLVPDTLDDLNALQPVELGAEATAILAQVESAVDNMTDPSSLATALSPLVDSASALTDSTESAVALSAIATAQSSAEFWYADNYAQMRSVASASSADLSERCSNGELEGTYYEAGGTSYYCDADGNWYAFASAPRRSKQAQFRFASIERVMVCEISAGDSYAIIGLADAMGAIYGGLRGARWGAWGAAIGAAYMGVRASGQTAWVALAATLWCEF